MQLGVALLTVRDENGFYGVQHDPFGGEGAGAPPDEIQHSYGFIGRPLDADKGRGCAVWYEFSGKEGLAFLGHDPRTAEKIPPIKKGGSAQYASDGSFTVFDPETHTRTTYVPYAQGKAHLETVGLDGNGTPIVEYVHGEGMALTMLGRTLVIKNADGSSYIQLDDNGCILNANLKVTGAVEVNGAKIMPTGDVVTATGVSLMTHTHLTPLGPTGPALPTGP